MRTLRTLLLPVCVATPQYENAIDSPESVFRALVVLFRRLDFQAILGIPGT